VSVESPLEGENQDELDAAADRDRGARYERTCGYGVAERHRHPECPKNPARVNSPFGEVAAGLSADYHRSSMVREAKTPRDRPAGAPVAPFSPIPFVASKRR
jgi:hypothetical protein